MGGALIKRTPRGCGTSRTGVVATAFVVLACAGGPAAESSTSQWILTEVARYGGAEEGLASFNVVLDLQFAHDASLWVLDGQTQTIRRFDAGSGAATLVAGRGKGPGELEMANGVRRAPDGEMWARDFGNNRLSRYTSDGRFRGQHILPPHSYEYRWGATVDSSGRVIDLLYVPDADSMKRAIVSFGADGSAPDTSDFPLACSDVPPAVPNIPGRDGGFVSLPYAADLLVRLSAQGELWCGRSDQYAFRRFQRVRASHVAQVSSDSATVPVSEAARDSAIATTEEELRRIGGPATPWNHDLVPRTRPAIRSLATDDEDRLWVLRDRVDGSVGFDVWDSEGRRLATAEIPPSLRPASTFRVHRGKLAIIVRDQDDVPSVAIFSVSPAPVNRD